MPPEQQVGFLVGAVIGALVVGTLCGLIPFFVGRSKNRIGLGVAGLVACVIGGFLLGVLLAGPMAIVFTVIIMALGDASQTNEQRSE